LKSKVFIKTESSLFTHKSEVIKVSKNIHSDKILRLEKNGKVESTELSFSKFKKYHSKYRQKPFTQKFEWSRHKIESDKGAFEVHVFQDEIEKYFKIREWDKVEMKPPPMGWASFKKKCLLKKCKITKTQDYERYY
jgi:hypothetical protein